MSVHTTAARLVAQRGANITLTRITEAAPEPSTPWIPGARVLDVYTLKAVVSGASADYVDGATVLASDLMAATSPKAVHTLSGGAPADGATVDIVPRMSDVLTIGGEEKTIKAIKPAPAAGPPALFRIFVAS